MGWRDSYYGVHTATVAMQWFGQHVSTIEAVISVWSVRKLYNDSYRQNRFQFLSDSDKVESPGGFSSWEYKDENEAWIVMINWERIGTTSTEEYKRSAYEDLTCALKALWML
jgi:hypothetical protein